MKSHELENETQERFNGFPSSDCSMRDILRPVERRRTATGYPLLRTLLECKGLELQATYSCSELAQVFGVSARTIQKRVADGTLQARKLVGGGRFLAEDIESYLTQAATSQIYLRG